MSQTYERRGNLLNIDFNPEREDGDDSDIFDAFFASSQHPDSDKEKMRSIIASGRLGETFEDDYRMLIQHLGDGVPRSQRDAEIVDECLRAILATEDEKIIEDNLAVMEKVLEVYRSQENIYS